MLTLPRDILYLLPVSLRTSVNLSRTCKWIHKLMNPVVINHTYIDGCKENTIYEDENYIITYKDGLYDVYQNFNLGGIFKNFKFVPSHIHERVNIQELSKEIFSILVDGKRLEEKEEHIISNEPIPSYRIRLPYKDDGYLKLPSVCNLDKYYRIYAEDELALDIVYNAAIQGKQVDICTANLDAYTIEVIKQNNYVNNLHNVRLIEKVEDNNYDLAIYNDPEVVKPIMNELYNTDIIIFFDNTSAVEASEALIKYNSILPSDRVMQLFQYNYGCIVYKHYLSIDYNTNLNQAAIASLPEGVMKMIANAGLIICPSCLYAGDNVDIIQLMRESSRKYGGLWEQLWKEYGCLYQ